MSQSPPPYTPPPEIVAAAEEALASARVHEINRAEALYDAYCLTTGRRSAVTGAELPYFGKCSVLVRAGWLAAARAVDW